MTTSVSVSMAYVRHMTASVARTGAFDASMAGIRLCRERDIKVGLRFTMTEDNAAELPDMLQLMADEDVNKFYLSHLNYAGRGNRNRDSDVQLQYHPRTPWTCCSRRHWRMRSDGDDVEFVTGNNDADGVYLLQWVRQHYPDNGDHIAAKLRAVGRQQLRRQYRQYRQSRGCPPGHFLVALRPRKCPSAAIFRNLAGHLRPDHGRA